MHGVLRFTTKSAKTQLISQTSLVIIRYSSGKVILQDKSPNIKHQPIKYDPRTLFPVLG